MPDWEPDPITQKIINCAYKVANHFGTGFLEKVYENSLAYELKTIGFKVGQQYPIEIQYEGVIVGNYIADLLVNDTVIIEVKAIKAIEDIHFSQCLHYLKATGKKTCLLLNFGSPSLGIKRISN